MKEGDYIRTIYGIKRITDIVCGQDIRFDNTDGFDEDLLNYHDYDGISKNSHTWEEIVIGEPKEKIIDLIEVGDYVNGRYVDKYQGKLGNFSELPNGKWEFIELSNEHYLISSIVTKEQFKEMEYRIGDD